MELLRLRHRRLGRRRQEHAHRSAAVRLETASSRTSSTPSKHSSRPAGEEDVNLALLTDGLRAEREQGITIDVAYRYFATPKRKFIIADTPGHIQYTRNMVTGASTADLAIVLIDARNGIVEQSRRHAFLAPLLGVPHLVAVRQQDGPRRLRPGRLRAHQGRVPRASRRSSTCTTSPSSRCRPSSATTSSSARPTCRGTRARRCCTTSKRCTSRRTAT